MSDSLEAVAIPPARWWRWIRAFAGILFVLLVLKNAWVCDDAYISFRVVDNIHNGLGLRWNPVERVQVFTHPSWLLIVAALTLVTRSIYLTVLALSVFLAALFAWLIGWKLVTRADNAAAVLIAMSASAALVDFSTSGLENPLLNVLLVALCWYASRDNPTRHLATIVALGSLAILTRPDAVVLVGPIVLWTTWRARRNRPLIPLLIGSSPLIVWSAFATIYFGSPVPNTVFAKVGTGIPISALLRQGMLYLYEAAIHDPVTIVVIIFGAGLGLLGKATDRALAAGVVLSILAVMRVGGDFMAGRFLVAPFVVALVLLGRLLPERKYLRTATITAFVVLGFPAPRSPLLPLPDDITTWHGITNERAVYGPTTGLMQSLQNGIFTPRHAWVEAGLDYRANAAGQAVVTYNAGFMGYFAGPGVHLVDVFALTDPVLSRLPVTEAQNWRPGHFKREFPPHYVEGIKHKTFSVADPNLQPFVDDLRSLSSGRLFSRERRAAFARILTRRWAGRQERQKDLAEARTRGALFFDAGDFDESISWFERAVSIDSERPRSWWWLARSLDAAGRPGRALEAVRTALALDRWDLDACQFEAQMLVQSGGDAWRQVLDRSPPALEACLVATSRLIEQNRLIEAVELITSVLDGPFEVCRFRDAPQARGTLEYRRDLEATGRRLLALAFSMSGQRARATLESDRAAVLSRTRPAD